MKKVFLEKQFEFCGMSSFVNVSVRVFSGAVRASSLFPILSVGLLFIGGVCVAASEFYKSRHNVILSAGIFFVSAGLYTHLHTF